MNEDELLALITITLIPDVGSVLTRSLLDHFGAASLVLKARTHELARIEGIGLARAMAIRKQACGHLAEKELKRIKEHDIRLITYRDANYPNKLLNCNDAPAILYCKGPQSNTHSRVVSIVGSRQFTPYGKHMTEQIVEELAGHGVVVVSGLAHGIDAIAHKAALRMGIPTWGVMAHGFGTMYPHHHRSLAAEIAEKGALVTEFCFEDLPDKHHFPRRNRIVAGMADATIVVETAVRGGSMITAELAFGYNRDVWAIPGRLNDTRSQGCLQLIAQNKASLFTNTQAFLESMGWKDRKSTAPTHLRLFHELTPNAQALIQLLSKAGKLQVDEWLLAAGLSSSVFAAALLELEMQGLVRSLPGKCYQCT